MPSYHFQLALSPDEYLPYYRGDVRYVVVRCDNGQALQFPARLLRPFVSAGGIRGRFELSCDTQGKGASLHRHSD